MSLDHGPYYGQDWHNPPARPVNPAMNDLWYCHNDKVWFSNTINMQQLHADHFTLEPIEQLTHSAPMAEDTLDATHDSLIAYARNCDKRLADIQMQMAGQLEIVHYHNNGLRSTIEHDKATATLNDMILIAKGIKTELATAKEAIRQYENERLPNWDITSINPADQGDVN